MKVKELRELIDFISNTGLEEVNIETEEFKVQVKRSPETTTVAAAPQVHAPAPVVAPPAAPAPSATAAPEVNTGAPAASNLIEVKSPMIGTFYRSPNPESPSFIEVGDKIKPGDTVCIVEAMKLFNEIEAEVSGTVVEILVDNASPVEYDQPLFLVDPS
jgi:acetyl-CoA carboxylase biotin carboxyl carrier protein